MTKPYTPNDAWSRRAAAEGYRARSVYKLMELDQKFHLLGPGLRVLDLGAAPGSWLQYAAKSVSASGHVLGLDFQPIKPIAPNVATRICDITDVSAVEKEIAVMGWKGVDLVLSDLAPNTSGIKDVDQWRSIELSEAALVIARRFLRRGGTLVMKIFRGRDFDAFLKRVKASFPDAKIVTVKASRERSREVYVVARG